MSKASPETSQQRHHHRLRAWREVFDPSAVAPPSDYGDAMDRIRRNADLFRYNYSVAILVVVFLNLVYHPISIIVFLFVILAWFFLCFFRHGELVVFGRSVDDTAVICSLWLATVVVLVFTGVGMNVLVSLLVGVAIVGFHASFRNSDCLYEQESVEEERLLLSNFSLL